MTAGRIFVGRRRELALLRRELTSGRHLVLTGPFGIGRTALVRQAAQGMGAGWRFLFLDGSRTPSSLCGDLLAELSPTRPLPRAREGLSYRACKSLVAATRLPGSCRHVMVLDDLVRLSQPKAAWLRWALSLKRFLVVAVVERSLPSDELARLRGLLFGAKLVSLSGLSAPAIEELLAACSCRFGLDWGSESRHAMAVATHGHPLGAWTFVETARTKGAGSP